MRVLHVIATGQRRGAEIFASDLVGALDDAGLSQRVAVLRNAGGMAVPFRVSPALLDVNGRKLPGLRMSWGTLRALRAMIKEYNPDILQAHGGEPLKYSVIAAANTPTRVVYRKIGLAPPWLHQRPRRSAYRLLMRRTAGIVAVADTVRSEIGDLFEISERVVKIPRGIDSRRLEPVNGREQTRAGLGIDSSARVILTLGALTWEKDPLGLLDVSAAVLDKSPGAVHVIAGEGPLRRDLEAGVQEKGLNGRVILLGSRADVADLLTASDVMLLASKTEGMPGAVIEAGMVGLPVAAYAVAGVPEVVENGVTGLLAPPGAKRELEQCVLELLKDTQARRAIAESARERCRERFDIRTIAPRYIELYGSLLNQD